MIDEFNQTKNLRNKIILALLAFLIIFITTLGISYAYFSAVTVSEVQIINTGTLSLRFDDDTNIIRNENIYPISRNQIQTQATKKTFSITNSSTTNMYLILSLEEMKLPDELRNVDFNWALYQNNIMQTTGSFNISKDSSKVILSNYEFLESGKSRKYDIYIWIEESGVEQDLMQGKIFNARIVANGVSALGEDTIGTVIKNKDIVNESNTDGLFKTSINTLNNGTTYYYKGNVTNNYLSFAGHLWRIIRINEDGSIRLILETDIGIKKYSSNTTCTSNNLVNCTTNYSVSNLKTVLNKWYSTTIESNENLDNKVITGKFCNDISNTFANRITNPTFDCTNIVEAKVGMISADELSYSLTNNITYLNNNTSFYTMTSSSNSMVYKWNSDSMSLENNANVFDYYNLRPVINLDPSTIITSGGGTINNPYIVN